ncbi:MAG: adaptor protein MecA [Butyrivibrio sp.]
MKIEKISDNQIRCTLTRTDLLSREIKISELAYGTEKAKLLFHDMIEQASHQFGFEADDIPLMIEAIPVSPDCIVLVITKVEDPEELDTRFSKFAPAKEEGDEFYEDDNDDLLEIDEFFDALDNSITSEDEADNDFREPDGFIPISETLSEKDNDNPVKSSEFSESGPVPAEAVRIFSFESWSEAARAAEDVYRTFSGKSSLYKDDVSGKYYLVITGTSDDAHSFLDTCNTLSEFGRREKANYATLSFYNEQFCLLIKENALQILAEY